MSRCLILFFMNHEYSDKLVTPWGGMQEMKKLIDKTGISKKLGELNLPEGYILNEKINQKDN